MEAEGSESAPDTNCCGAGFGGEDDREMEQLGRLPPNTGIERS